MFLARLIKKCSVFLIKVDEQGNLLSLQFCSFIYQQGTNHCYQILPELCHRKEYK